MIKYFIYKTLNFNTPNYLFHSQISIFKLKIFSIKIKFQDFFKKTNYSQTLIRILKKLYLKKLFLKRFLILNSIYDNKKNNRNFK
jgi:hypothetical protein